MALCCNCGCCRRTCRHFFYLTMRLFFFFFNFILFSLCQFTYFAYLIPYSDSMFGFLSFPSYIFFINLSLVFFILLLLRPFMLLPLLQLRLQLQQLALLILLLLLLCCPLAVAVITKCKNSRTDQYIIGQRSSVNSSIFMAQPNFFYVAYFLFIDLFGIFIFGFVLFIYFYFQLIIFFVDQFFPNFQPSPPLFPNIVRHFRCSFPVSFIFSYCNSFSFFSFLYVILFFSCPLLRQFLFIYRFS